MKKRIWSLLLAVSVVLSLLTVSAFAEINVARKTYGDVTYFLDYDAGTASVVSCDKRVEGTVTIPAEVDGLPVIKIDNGAFQYSTVSNVVIPEGVTEIGNYTFNQCGRLKSIVIPEGVKSIGEFAFRGTGLKSVDLPDSLRHIGDYAFCETSKLEQIEFPKKLRTIGESAFESSAIVTVTLPGRLEKIGNAAFSNCSSLTKAVVEEGVESIGGGNFSECMQLEAVELPSTLKRLGRGALESPKLRGVVLPEGMTYIGVNGRLSEVLDPSLISRENGVTYARTYVIGVDRNLTDLKLRPDTTVLMEQACRGREKLKTADLTSALTAIEESTFENCYALTKLVLPAGLKEIGNYAFKNTNALRALSLPDGLQKIREEAFNCCGIEALVIPDGVTTMGNAAFQDCRQLQSLTLPGSLRKIPFQAFESCALKEVVIPEGVEEIGAEAFQSNKTERLSLPLSIKSIGREAFYNVNSRYVKDVAYAGTEAQWKKVKLGEDCGVKISWGEETPAPTPTPKPTPTPTPTPSPKPTTPPDPGYVEPFTDVPDNAFYAQAVSWAVAREVTNGTSPTTFSPAKPCTRGQVVTFLWRAAGSPEPQSTKNPFKDVKKDAYYYKAVLWAVEQGITNGTSEKTFSPESPCTRGQVVTFLYRNAGTPEISAKNPFKDVKSGAFYYDAVQWAVKYQVTNGTSDTTFGPGQTCTRGQIVTFLFRASMHNALS